MITATFPRKGAGTGEDPFTPDFSSLGYIPETWGVLSRTLSAPFTFTVRYQPQ